MLVGERHLGRTIGPGLARHLVLTEMAGQLEHPVFLFVLSRWRDNVNHGVASSYDSGESSSSSLTI